MPTSRAAYLEISTTTLAHTLGLRAHKLYDDEWYIPLARGWTLEISSSPWNFTAVVTGVKARFPGEGAGVPMASRQALLAWLDHLGVQSYDACAAGAAALCGMARGGANHGALQTATHASSLERMKLAALALQPAPFLAPELRCLDPEVLF